MRICVYGAASPTIDPTFVEITEKLGREMAKRGHSLVFGGGANGLMGAVARGVRDEKGEILGVIPNFFFDDYVEAICDFCTELVRCETMRERKKIMEDNADAFIVAPGGIGTFEEFFEILTSKQLCRHNKPIVLFNLKDYYKELSTMMEASVEKNFVKENCLELYKVTGEIDEIFEYLEGPHEIRTVRELKDG